MVFLCPGAAWVTLDEIQNPAFRLRGLEPFVWCSHVANGGSVSPMSLFGDENYHGAMAARAAGAPVTGAVTDAK